MRLEQAQKELVAIGASIGANCRPCIEHHVPAAREAGLSETQLVEALAIAEAVRDEAIALLSGTAHALLGRAGVAPAPRAVGATSQTSELVALGVSVGANSHPLLHLHVAAALATGLTAAEIEAALKMAEYVQHRAAEMTAEKAAQGLDAATVASANRNRGVNT